MEMLPTLRGKAGPGAEPWALTLGPPRLDHHTSWMECGFYHLSERFKSGKQPLVIEVDLFPQTQALE